MKKTVQIILIVWFILLNLFILIPSFNLLFNYTEETANESIKVPDLPPAVPKLEILNSSAPEKTQDNQVKIATQQVQAYAQQIAAYTQQITAYTQEVNLEKLKMDNSKKGSAITRYNTVIKDSLLTLLGGFATAFITFAFVNAGTTLANNYLRAKNNQPVTPITFW